MKRIGRITQSFRNLPLSGKINVIILISIFLSQGLLIGFFVNISRDVTIQNSIDAGIRNLDLIGENLESIYRYADAFSRIIATDNELQAMSSKRPGSSMAVRLEEEYLVRIILDGVIQQRDIVSSVVIRFLDGRVFGSGHVDMKKLAASSDEMSGLPADFLVDLQPPFVVATRPIGYEINENETQSLALIRQFISVEKASVVGIIVLNIREELLTRFLADARNPEAMPTFLIDSDGGVIASSLPEPERVSLKDASYYPDLLSADSSSFIHLIDGQKYLVTQKRISNQGWRLVRLALLSDLLLPGRRIILLIFGIGGMALLVSSLLSVLLSRYITKPVRDLTMAMDLAGQGDLEIRVEESDNDELGKMTRYFNRMVGQISDLMSEVYQEQSDRRRFELMALQTQIRPHFLYNALDGVCALVQLGRTDDAFRMSKALSLFYRGALSGGRNVITLEEELDIVEQYLTIQSFRYSGNFSYSIEVPKKFRRRRALKLSLQPLVENALYHGIRGLPRPGTIVIRAEDMDVGYRLVVQDNGRGFPEDHSDGFGINSVRERVKLYFGAEGDLTWSSQQELTTVSIILPELGATDV